MSCPFCNVSPERVIGKNQHARAMRDGYPVNPGHTLIFTGRHVASWFDASQGERLALLQLVDELKTQIDEKHAPDGYNLGVNIGEVAGQTVPHLHVHLIPRFAGDVDDPTGGVRLVIPELGNYQRPGFIPKAKVRE